MTAKVARRIASAGSLLMLAAGALLIPASTASAAERDGVCDVGEVCFYYNSNQQGSVSDFSESLPVYGGSQPNCYEFKGAGDGQGLCVKNNAASVWNRTSSKIVTVYLNSNYDDGGSEKGRQTIAPDEKVNLQDGLKNDNASHQFSEAFKQCVKGLCAV